jgi:hypothetical protein
MARESRCDRTKEKFWRRMLRGQTWSGLSIRAWCREHDLHEHAFYWWRARLALTGRGRKMRSGNPTLIPVQVFAEKMTCPEGQVEIVLSDDHRIRIRGPVDRQMLADVLAVLATASHPERLEASRC